MPERILVIQTAFIGDAILTLPMLQVLKDKNPDAAVDVVAIPSTRIIFEHSPVVNNVYVFEKRGERKSFTGILAFANILKKRRYDVIYSPHRSFRTSLLVWLSGVKQTYGFSNASGKLMYKKLVEYDRSAHEVERNLSLISYEAKDISGLLPVVTSGSEVKEKVSGYVAKLNAGKLAAAAPGSVWNTKRYPIEHYKEIVKSLSEKGYKTLLMGGKGDMELAIEINREYPDTTVVTAGQFDLIESIELLKYCGILICNDSAPTHMAMCADIPVLTLYCSTVAGFGFYPYSKKSRYLSYDDLECKPCGIHGHKKCPINNFLCGQKLAPQMVIRQIEELLISTIGG